VDCGRAGELATIAEGFTGIGWCASCSREAQQGKLEMRGAR
jgi:hypothetical protein